MQAFQNKNKILNVDLEAGAGGGLISALEAELTRAKIKLATLKRQFVDSNAPEIIVARNQIIEIKSQIEAERNDLVSPSGKNLNAKAAEMAQLTSQLEFSTELYKASIATAEKTRVDSLQQQRFMAVLSQPMRPDQPWQDWRTKGFLITLAIILSGYGLTKFILGMADSHKN